jgi:hypothetical protein
MQRGTGRSSPSRPMASNFTKRLDRLERLIRERTLADTSPHYLRGGEPVPNGVDPERVVFIVAAFVEPPEREEEQLPEMRVQSEPEPERVRGFDGPLNYPVLGNRLALISYQRSLL